MAFVPDVEFEIPVPVSSKNSRILTRDGSGRPRSFPSRAARRSMEQIRSAAHQAVDKARKSGDFKDDGPLFGDDEVAVEVTHVVPTDKVTVKLRSLGPRIKGKSGRRRDIQNCPEGVLDALEGIIYKNDNQVGALLVRRSHWPYCWGEDGEDRTADQEVG